MAGTNFPQGTSVSIVDRSRADPAKEIRKTSLDQEGAPPRSDVSPGAYSLTWLFLLMMIGLGVVAIVIIVTSGLSRLPAWP